MIDLAGVRAALAERVTGAGMPCLPYAPDNPQPPLAFIDSLSLDYQSPVAYALPTTGTGVVVACGQRHDQPAAVAELESKVGAVVAALQSLPGVRIVAVASGTAEIGKTELPAVSYTIQFPTS